MTNVRKKIVKFSFYTDCNYNSAQFRLPHIILFIITVAIIYFGLSKSTVR